jgi:hypothetical protein
MKCLCTLNYVILNSVNIPINLHFLKSDHDRVQQSWLTKPDRIFITNFNFSTEKLMEGKGPLGTTEVT